LHSKANILKYPSFSVLTAQFEDQNAATQLISVGEDGKDVVLEDVGLVRWLQVGVHIRVLHLEGVVPLNLFHIQNIYN